jgi:menaquinone-dependent protoporphyrinogen oxidase
VLYPSGASEVSVLVAYASRHGATGEIAEHIAAGLRASGQPADARPIHEAGDLEDYEGFVIGSATYSTHWLTDATAFVRCNQELLAERPVWLFSSGPLGAEVTPATLVDLIAAFGPKEIYWLQAAIHPREHRIFYGALISGGLSFIESASRKRRATRLILPEGDFRNWAQIRGWAEGIARELAQPATWPEAISCKP